ncbi:MAG: J domain-containing protein, partial [Chloroflexi bacterium]|nr:J domain-containing protein [Chloroflexota bacterium]
MHNVPDPYRLLGLRRDATVAEIKSAHRALAKRYHPDAPGGNRDRFLALQEAYQVLADPLRRREWDRRHAPGPVRADDPISRSRTNRQPPGEPRPRPARGPGAAADAGTAGRRSSSPRPAAQPGRAGQADGASAGYTWSARDVPWWESGNRSPGARRTDATTDEARSGPVREGRGGGAEGPPAQASEGSSAPRRPTEFDVYSRSSGAAWSSAARAYFRRTTDDLPKGRYAPRPRTAPRPGGPPQQPQG